MKKWTDEQKQYLKENCGNMTAQDIATQLAKTKYDVQCMAKELGVLTMKRVRVKSGDIIYNGSPCLIFMTLEQICNASRLKIIAK